MLFDYKKDKENYDKNYSFYRFEKLEFVDGSTNEQSDETISQWVNDAYEHCKKYKECYSASCGNAIVIGRYFAPDTDDGGDGGSIQIIVAQNYDEYTIELEGGNV